jgi:HEAT repeat protein
MKARPSRTEQTLVRLAAIAREAPPTAATELREALAHDRSLVIARAAEITYEMELHELGSDLVAAFARAVIAEDDPELVATDAVLKALARLEVDAPDVYLAALRMRRMVKMMGNWIDVAAPLRAHAAKALVTTSYTSALEQVAPMLADPEAIVRTAAAEALGVLGGSGAGAVLHLKLEIGDDDAGVLGACLSGLLRVALDRYLPIVAERLHNEDARLVELAAIALGESRAPDAFPVLRDAVESSPRSATASVLLALALLRREEATAHLLDLVAKAAPSLAGLAVAALAIHEHDEGVTTRVRAVVDARGDRTLRKALATHFRA